MKRLFAALSTSLVACTLASAHDDLRLPPGATFATLATTELAIEGLTGDRNGSFYTVGRNAGAGVRCPVWRIALTAATPVVVGFVPAPSGTASCSPSGLAFDAGGTLYISESDKVYAVKPDAASPALATVYASAVPGTNGLAFDANGNLWTGDGTTGLGRVWKVPPGGGAGIEMFRVQPMVNASGVGRDARSVPTGASQALVANGVAFNREGDMFIADTARGAIWKLSFDRRGNLQSRTGCDTTFTANTLCMENVFVAHPLLEGADGIALDVAGNIWVDANERNAVVVVGRDGEVVEAFRNPPDANGLRNAGPLEFPTSPFLMGDLLCTTNSDGNRRDNSPNTAGEVGGPGQRPGKVSCMNPRLHLRGLPLPVR
jgi:sugar lactone lactonase YvrE